MVGIDSKPRLIQPRRGDIHWIEFPEIDGHVIRGPRPAVVIQTDRLRRSSTVIVLPMTSSPKAARFRPPFLVQVRARDSGLDRDGWIKCDQPFTFPTIVLGPRSGRLGPEALALVDDAMRFVLAL